MSDLIEVIWDGPHGFIPNYGEARPGEPIRLSPELARSCIEDRLAHKASPALTKRKKVSTDTEET